MVYVLESRLGNMLKVNKLGKKEEKKGRKKLASLYNYITVPENKLMKL
jgi:hypothetical protein